MTQVSIFSFQDYRAFLRETLAQLKDKNSQFSLRALARKLEVPASYLSEVLNGKKSLSLEKALHLGRTMSLEGREVTYLCYLVALENCQDPEQRAVLSQEFETFNQNRNRVSLDVKKFEVISQWECIAIFELLSVYPRMNEDFYAQQLAISNEQAARAIRSLQDLGLVQKTDLGFEKTGQEIFVSSQHHHLALKMYHGAMLEKARHALYDQDPKTRYTGTETLMIDPSLLPEAHQIINECLDRLVGLFQKSDKKSSLVHVQVNLFELTKKKKAVS